MPVLSKSKHEQFAQSVAKGISPTEAYTSAGYATISAAQNACRLLKNKKVAERIEGLKREISRSLVQLEIRQRSARIQVLQEVLDRLRQVIAVRSVQYADDPVGATGMMVKEGRGKNGEKVVWSFDAALSAQILNVLKQAAREEGQWNQKRDADSAESLRVTIAILNAGRDRVAKARRELEADEAAKAGQPIPIHRDSA